MTAEEIQKRNKQIALMLNIKIEQCYPENKDYKQHGIVYTLEKEFAENVNSIFLSVSELKFHKDWRWLMEAVEFIEKLQSDNFYMEFFWLNGPNVSLYQKDKQKGLILWETHGRFKNVETKKEAVFIAVSDFAKLYNEKKL
jgi:hypothetical protein